MCRSSIILNIARRGFRAEKTPNNITYFAGKVTARTMGVNMIARVVNAMQLQSARDTPLRRVPSPCQGCGSSQATKTRSKDTFFQGACPTAGVGSRCTASGSHSCERVRQPIAIFFSCCHGGGGERWRLGAGCGEHRTVVDASVWRIVHLTDTGRMPLLRECTGDAHHAMQRSSGSGGRSPRDAARARLAPGPGPFTMLVCIDHASECPALTHVTNIKPFM